MFGKGLLHSLPPKGRVEEAVELNKTIPKMNLRRICSGNKELEFRSQPECGSGEIRGSGGLLKASRVCVGRCWRAIRKPFCHLTPEFSLLEALQCKLRLTGENVFRRESL
jgi:hypothetical protein